MDTELEQMIYMAAIFRGTNVAAIAREIGMTSSNLYRKMRCCTLKPSELARIAKILDIKYSYYFSFSKGTKIGKMEKKIKKKIMIT